MAKKVSYEETLQNLKDTLGNLESNELNIEDAIKEYEKGIKLVNKLYKTLNTYEGKISKVRDEEEVEFDYSDEY